MTDAESGPLDLSILAQVDNSPDADERPQTSRPQSTGGAPRGVATDEPPPRARRRRSPRARTEPPPDPPPRTGPREFIRADDVDELFAEYKPGIFVKPITEAYMMGAAVLMPFPRVQPIATAVMQNAENCAKAWDNAAKVDKRLRKRLMQMMQAGTFLPLWIAHMPILTVAGVVLFPGRKPPEVELPEQTGETFNPVSNGYQRGGRK